MDWMDWKKGIHYFCHGMVCCDNYDVVWCDMLCKFDFDFDFDFIEFFGVRELWNYGIGELWNYGIMDVV